MMVARLTAVRKASKTNRDDDRNDDDFDPLGPTKIQNFSDPWIIHLQILITVDI